MLVFKLLLYKRHFVKWETIKKPMPLLKAIAFDGDFNKTPILVLLKKAFLTKIPILKKRNSNSIGFFSALNYQY